jgi:phosphoribosylamine---glycine ligase
MRKILIIGSGGREHAIVWSLRKTSQEPVQLFCIPANAGIAQIADTPRPRLPQNDHTALIDFVESEQIDLTFVGPEAPLVSGIVDEFSQRGLRIVGPSAAAARLEGSKIFAKEFMARHKIPIAAFRLAGSPEEAIAALRSGEFGVGPVVIKADGLAAGKGVVVASDRAEAEKAVEDLMIHYVAGREAAQRVVIEEALTGREASLLVFADGQDYALMPAARDHKRIGENDTGPNTGGMGTITDVSVLDKGTQDRVVREIVEPTLAGAREEGFPFRGVLFLGLMLTDDGPKLLEYNVRFGDPETQAILVRLQTDLLSIFDSMYNGTLGALDIEWSEGASACVVAANKGYPGKYESGAVIEGLDEFKEGPVQVFHAGTSRDASGRITATGGRVLGITAGAQRLPDALSLCYGALEKIHWPGMQFRRDIGKS